MRRRLPALALACLAITACTGTPEQRPTPSAGWNLPSAPVSAAVPTATAAPSTTSPSAPPPPVTPGPLATIDDSARAFEHLTNLSAIAERHGHRTTGGDGYPPALDYVELTLRQAGFETTRETFLSNESVGASDLVLEIGDLDLMGTPLGGSASQGEPITAPLGFPATPQGCSQGDFDALASSVVFLEDGGCPLEQKVAAMTKVGVAGVLVAEPEGRAPQWLTNSRADFLMLSLAPDQAAQVKAMRGEPRQVRMGARVSYEVDEGVNLFATWPGTGDAKVVMMGAHLDAISPGANDNGSGVATVLALAERLAANGKAEGLRVAIWDAEEPGALGSISFAETRTPGQWSQISSYVNFDMVASPNGVLGLFGNGAALSSFEEAGKRLGIAYELIELVGTTDSEPIRILGGVDVVGVHTGSVQKITAEQARRFGSVAGEVADRCYHTFCDTLETVNTPAVRQRWGHIARLSLAGVEDLLANR